MSGLLKSIHGMLAVMARTKVLFVSGVCIENWNSVGTTKRVVTLFLPKCHTKQCHMLASVELSPRAVCFPCEQFRGIFWSQFHIYSLFLLTIVVVKIGGFQGYWWRASRIFSTVTSLGNGIKRRANSNRRSVPAFAKQNVEIRTYKPNGSH